MPPTAHIEWLMSRSSHRVGVLRVYESGSFNERSPYVWSCTVQKLGQSGELLGVCKRPHKSWLRAAEAALRAEGIKALLNERHGRKVKHE
jgi:hypothetical protein